MIECRELLIRTEPSQSIADDAVSVLCIDGDDQAIWIEVRLGENPSLKQGGSAERDAPPGSVGLVPHIDQERRVRVAEAAEDDHDRLSEPAK